ncbi:MAG: MlaD family protein [Solirubrobacteraceae bacterium]
MRRNQKQGLSRPAAGLILVVVLTVVTYLGFTKAIPFRHHFEIKADFQTSNNLRKNSFVRIGGVNVGKVTKIEPIAKGREGVRVTMRIDGKGRPIHKDATVKIRPRIFLEGNFFVELKPGTPSSPTLGDGDVIPMAHTATPVQLDQILTTLQSDTRKNLQVLLDELGTAFTDGGAIGFNKSVQYWLPAFKGSAIVNQATLGILEHDLSGYLRTSATVAEALDRDPAALKSLITDFNTTAAAFAVEQANLEGAVAELPRTLRAARPALGALNAAFPAVRRLIVDFRPAVRSSGPMIDATLPFIKQLRRFVGPSELRGLTADLRPLVPDLARLNTNLVPLYRQVRAASSCQNEVVLPWTKMTTPDPNFPAKGPVFQEGVKNLPGLGGESRSGDANGQWARVLAGNGVITYALGQAPGGAARFGQATFPILGVNPPKASRPPIRYDVPCETQQAPDLRTIPGQAPTPAATNFQPPALMTALSQAQAYEGVAAILNREGHPAAARRQILRAATIRQANNLEDKKLGEVNGRLRIVDGDSKAGLGPAGLPDDVLEKLRAAPPSARGRAAG